MGVDLIYLVVGVGLGLVGGRFTRSVEPVAGSKTSVSQAVATEHLEPLQEELKQTQLAYQMAQTMSQFKGGFLARISHELRSPLSSLIGLHQLILSDLCDSPEEAREFVAQANASALKMVKLLDEVVAVSKTEHGTSRLDHCALSLSRVFKDLQGLTHLQAANRNLQLEIIPPEPDLHILADPRRFGQVLLGLVDTAIAQMEDGRIQVTAAGSVTQEVHIWIDVYSSNNVWRESVNLLSTPLESGTPPNEPFKMSSGLTLMMVHSLLEGMQGRLEVLATDDAPAGIAAETFTRLQCSMPLTTPEIAELALVQD